jgi:hypothetical protein
LRLLGGGERHGRESLRPNESLTRALFAKWRWERRGRGKEWLLRKAAGWLFPDVTAPTGRLVMSTHRRFGSLKRLRRLMIRGREPAGLSRRLHYIRLGGNQVNHPHAECWGMPTGMWAPGRRGVQRVSFDRTAEISDSDRRPEASLPPPFIRRGEGGRVFSSGCFLPILREAPRPI